MGEDSVMTDQELVEEAKAGSSAAVGELYDRYMDAIYRFCYWQTNRNREEAEDLVQDIFIEVGKSVRTFKGKSSFKNWLYAIAKIRLNKWLRRKYQIPQVPLFESLSDSPTWIDPAEQAEKLKRLQALLDTLGEREQAVVKLRYLRNYTVRETSEELQVTEANVKTISHRALKKLQKLAVA